MFKNTCKESKTHLVRTTQRKNAPFYQNYEYRDLVIDFRKVKNYQNLRQIVFFFFNFGYGVEDRFKNDIYNIHKCYTL